MHYGAIKNCDIANGAGVRVTLFVSGCTQRCKGCFQPETWDFNYGKEFTLETENKIIEMLTPDYIKGLTVLGGEPFEPSNQAVLLPFLAKVRAKFPGKDIWCFSGFTFERLISGNEYPRTSYTDDMLKLIDVLVDGPFVLEKKNLMLKFRGSENQRILDLPKSLEASQAVIWSKINE